MIENLANGWKYKNCQSFFNIPISFIQFKLVGGGGGGLLPKGKTQYLKWPVEEKLTLARLPSTIIVQSQQHNKQQHNNKLY